MKRRIGLIIALVAVMCFTLAACGAPKTLEDYINSDSEAAAQLEDIEKANKGLQIDISGNTLTYTFDVSELGYSETVANNAKSALQNAIDGSASTYSGLAKQLEDESEISGIEVVVKYTYGDNVLASGTFTAN